VALGITEQGITVQGITTLGITSSGITGGVEFLLQLPAATSLTPIVGFLPINFSRASSAYVEDFEGVQRLVLTEEAPYRGARRVYNQLRFTEDITDVSWVKTNGNATTDTFTATSANATCFQSVTGAEGFWVSTAEISRITGTGTVELTLDGGSTYFDITSELTATPQRMYAYQGGLTNPNVGLRISDSGDAVRFTEAQLEDKTLIDNKNPDEYVSVDVLSSPYHGANVDGVKYFDTENGNTLPAEFLVQEGSLDLILLEGSTDALLLEG